MTGSALLKRQASLCAITSSDAVLHGWPLSAAWTLVGSCADAIAASQQHCA